MNKEYINIKQMMDLSNSLYELNKAKWMEKSPESGIYWIAWLIGEVGEVIDIVKKKGTQKIMHDNEIRKEMLTEITDCYMYLADILNRYSFTAEEFSKVYQEKMKFNLQRNYNRP